MPAVSARKPLWPTRPTTWLWIALGVALSLRLAWVALFTSNSFDLYGYWNAVHLWLSGVSPYSYAEPTHVFKYPPWTLPLFLPMALFSFEVWRRLWVLLELGAILYCVRWAVRARVNPDVAALVAALYWWIWLGHAQAGQFTLFIVASALWAVPPEADSQIVAGRSTFLALVLSSKVFNLFSLVGEIPSLLRRRTLAVGLATFVALNVLVLEVLHFRGNPVTLRDFYVGWIRAAGSGGAVFSPATIRGQGNHGFTALVMRLRHVPPEDTSADVKVALALGVLLSAVWFGFSRRLARAERWAGWLVVGTVINPLLWHHSFVLCYPACALAADRALKSKRLPLVIMAFAATFLIAILIPNIFGVDFVAPFELKASKSWGAALACATLVLAERA